MKEDIRALKELLMQEQEHKHLCYICFCEMHEDIEGGVESINEDEQEYKEHTIWVCDNCEN